MNLWLTLIGSLIFVAALGGTYMKGQHDGIAMEKGHQHDLTEAVRLGAEAAGQLAAEKIAEAQLTNRTIYQRTVHEVVKEPVYRDCVNTPAGMRDINDALRGTLSPDAAGEIELPQDVTGADRR